MQTARRLYVYLLSGISLGALVTGIVMLLDVLFDAIGLRSTSQLSGGPSSREQLVLAAAITLVALPVWLAHWIAAERSVAAGRPSADAERGSAVRGLYFALVMAVLLIVTAISVGSLLQFAVLTLSGASGFLLQPADDLARALVAGAAWAYHVAIRARDWRSSPISGAGAFLPRSYLYGASLIGLFGLLSGVVGAAETAGRLLLDEPTLTPAFGDDGAWWAHPLAGAVSGALVGGAVWIGHFAFATRLLADSGWRGASERQARLRLAYFVLAILGTAVSALVQLVMSASTALRAALGIDGPASSSVSPSMIVLPLIGAAVFGTGWWLHRRWLLAESEDLGPYERVRTAGRLEEYANAIVGLGFLAGGLATLIGTLIDAIGGPGGTLSGGTLLESQLAWAVPATGFGLALWAWSWRRVEARYAVAPDEEAAATSRRATLLVVVAVSLLSGIGSLTFIVYRLLGAAIGVPGGVDLANELAQPIGVLLVVLVVGLYHVALLRRDQRARRPTEAESAAAPPAGEPAGAVPAPVVAAPVAAPSVVLRLVGPAGSDLAATAARLRAALPAGYSLETVAQDGG